jgi:titin
LTASQVAGDTKVLLNWTDNSANETSFKIGRSDGINSTTITVAADLKTYTDTGLTPNATYSYSIAASNGKGESNWIPAPNPVTISGIAYATVARKADDTVTKGSWVGTYGNQSYDMISSKKAATGVALASSGLINIWAASTTDVRGLQTPDKTSRTARCYYSIPAYGLTSFDLDVNLADNATHKVSLYCVDWDTVKRNQMIQVVDCNYNTVIDERTITGFNGGMYLVWEVKGHVLFRIVNNSTSSGNAVVSGIFIDDPNYVTPTLPAAPGNLIAAPGSSAGKINLAWTDRSSNENGFVIQRSTKSSSGFTTIITLGAGATSYGDSGLKSGILYYYRVYAFNTAGSSGYISASAKAK